jgi:hypothetical protein
MNKIEFTTKNARTLSSWLKRFSVLDNSLLIELDLKNNNFIAKSHDEQRSSVKSSKIGFVDAGLSIKSTKEQKRIKVGIYNIPKLIKTFDHFNDEEFTFSINYDELSTGDVKEFAGINLGLKNNSLKVTSDCTSLTIFKYISDDIFNNKIAATDNLMTTFKLDSKVIEKINSLSNLDNDNKFLEIKSKDNNVYACGKTFEFLISEVTNAKDYSLNIFKDQFSKLDIEDYEVSMGEDRLIFKSESSLTTCVLSMIEKED